MISDKLKGILGIEECIRYYPQNIKEIKNSEVIFRNDREIDLYFHIPFCKTPCSFCPFNRYLYKEEEVKSYILAMEKEVKIIKKLNNLSQLKINTIWIGGGTPTDLDENSLERILKIIKDNFNLDYIKEFTVEAKPFLKILTDLKLRLLKKYKVNRISLGVQSTNPKYLKLLGRGYDPDEAFEMIKRIKKYNFILNIDMIYRLPGQTKKEVIGDIDRVKSLGIDHFSWFHYISHKGTPMTQKMDKGELPNQANRNQYFEMFKIISKKMRQEGYSQYSPYYYSKEKKCQYHVDRWQMPQLETLGIGAGAFSFFNGWIYTNAHSVNHYKKIVNSKKPPMVMGKKLDSIEKITRLAVLGIKLFTIDLNEFEKNSGVKMDIFYKKELKILEKLELIKVNKKQISCTLLGKAFNNDIAMYFSTNSLKLLGQPQALQIIKKGL